MFFHSKKKQGFSLLEILTSVLLLAGLISIVVQISYGNTRRLKKARQLEIAAVLLEKKMLELEEEFKGSKISELPSEDEGEFEEAENYFWSYQTQPLALPSPDLLVSLLKVPDNEMNRKMVGMINGVLSATVVELKLTVRYKRKKQRVFSYSLVSYFINYKDAQDFIFKYLSGFLPEGSGL